MLRTLPGLLSAAEQPASGPVDRDAYCWGAANAVVGVRRLCLPIESERYL